VVEQKVETFSPGTLQPQTRSQKDTRESFAGQGADAQAAAGGVPGTQANIPTYQAGAAGGAGGGTSSYQKSEVTSNYEVSSDKRAISRAPGELKNVGIAVMIDQAVQNIQAEQLTQAVSAAVGLQPARGDQIAVVTVPFDTTMSANLAKTIEDETAQARQNDLIQMGVKAGGLVVALIGMALLFRMLSASIRPAGVAGAGGVDGAGLLPDGKGGVAALQTPEAIEAQISALMSGDGAELPPHVLAAMSPEERARYEAARVRSRQLSPSERARRREEVRRLAMEQPALIGETLSKWMAVDSAMAGAS
jgi:flagellar M-ring protein FliF